MLDKGYVDHLEVVNKQVVRVYLRPDAPAQLAAGRGSRYYFTIGTFIGPSGLTVFRIGRIV